MGHRGRLPRHRHRRIPGRCAPRSCRRRGAHDRLRQTLVPRVTLRLPPNLPDCNRAVLNKILSRAPLHAHADPAQRVLGIAELLPESAELLQLLRADPVPEVRAAAARRCSDGAALLDGWQVDAEPQVRTAIVESLGRWLDGIDGERLRAAVEGIGDQALLVELALTARMRRPGWLPPSGSARKTRCAGSPTLPRTKTAASHGWLDSASRQSTVALRRHRRPTNCSRRPRRSSSNPAPS